MRTCHLLSAKIPDIKKKLSIISRNLAKKYYAFIAAISRFL